MFCIGGTDLLNFKEDLYRLLYAKIREGTKDMRRKIYLTAAVMAAGAVLFAGCGSQNEDSSVSDTEAAEAEALNYEVKDYVKLGDYKGLDIKYPVPSVTEDDIGLCIMELIDENTEYNEITDRGAAEGDSVNIDFTGTIDGEEFDGGSSEDYEFILGEGEFLDDFESNLIGKNAKETVTFSLTFPEDYYDDTAGKTAEFSVVINSVSEVITPEYNDAFVAEVTDYDTMEAYEDSLREELMISAQEESELAAGEDALQQAIENAEINGYPQALYDACYNDTLESYQMYAEMLGMELEEFLSDYMENEDMEEVTISWVNEILVSQAIAEKEGFAITDRNYEEEAKAMAVEYGYDSLEDLEADYGKVSIVAALIRDKAISFLYDSADVTEVSEEEYYGEDEEDLFLEDTEELITDTEVIFMEDTE